MKNYTKISKDLNSKGFSLVDDVLPLELAEEINEVYSQNEEWELIDQVRENHYNSILKSDNEFLPRPHEYYSAKFNRSKSLESTDIIKNTFNEYFVPLLKKVSPFEMNEFDVRCYKLDKTDHYRSHNDDYAGTVNFIYYVNGQTLNSTVNSVFDGESIFVEIVVKQFVIWTLIILLSLMTMVSLNQDVQF